MKNELTLLSVFTAGRPHSQNAAATAKTAAAATLTAATASTASTAATTATPAATTVTAEVIVPAVRPFE